MMTRPDLISELRSIQNTLSNECCGTLLDKTDLIGRLTTVIDQLDYRPGKRRVVCAANKFPDGTIILGARHWDPLMRATFKKLYIDRHEAGLEQQGFIDQYQNFMTREEAWVVAMEAGQIIRRVGGDDDCLYSENIC